MSPFAARASALLVGRRLIPAPLVLLAARGREDFPGEVVAVLLAPEPTPAVLPHPWDLRAEDPVDRRIAVRDVHARDLVVAVVLARPADRRVDRRGGIASLGEPADRLRSTRVVDGDVEYVARVQALALGVQGVSRVFDRQQLISREELDVVEARNRPVALVEERERAMVRRRIALRELEDRRPAAGAARARHRVAVLGAGGVRIAGLVKIELAETGAGPEDAVLRPLERRPLRRLRHNVRIERGVALDGCVVDGHPPGVVRLSVRAQRDLIRSEDRGLRFEGDRVARIHDLQHLEFPIVEIARQPNSYVYRYVPR